MGEPSSGVLPSLQASDDRLDSWKEIAAYLNRDVTTVQRWEKREGMPVHRHQHDRMGSVFASRMELDAWEHSRNLRAAQENGNLVPSPDSSAPPSPPAKLPSLTDRIKWKLALVLVGAVALLAIGTSFWLSRTEHFWRSPIADARFQTITDFSGVAQAAAVSRDGHFAAFLSDRDGQMDVWVTQIGSGQFHNLTRGSAPELVNPLIRTLGFSPDDSLVTYWARKQDDSGSPNISIWAVPILGGQPAPYLEGVAEFDWSRDGSRLAYHTPGPGDPLFVSHGNRQTGDRPIFVAPAGLHSHFPLWSPDAAFIYFVQGSLPDKLDIWRIPSAGGSPERITSHNARVTYPVLLDRHTLMYLASDADGSGPWLQSTDVERRIPHRLSSGLDLVSPRWPSVLTAAVWLPRSRVRRQRSGGCRSAIHPREASAATPISSSDDGPGVLPRLGPDFLLYISATGAGDSIWKFADGTSTELWSSEDARVIGGPAISRNGRSIAFSVSRRGQTLLYMMQANGMNARIVTDSLNLQGAPAWTADGQSIISAAVDHGVPHLFRIPINGRPPTVFVQEYSVDPAWASDGRFAVYSGPDIGTTFSVKAASAETAPLSLRTLTLTRGARHMAFLPGGHALVVLRGEIQHKDLWLIDLDTGAERQLTNFPPEFNIRDFDISPDGHEAVLERLQERSDVVLLGSCRGHNPASSTHLT